MKEVWVATSQLGDALRNSQKIRDYADAVRFCRNIGRNDPPFTKTLATLLAGASIFEAQPLILCWLLNYHPEIKNLLQTSQGKEFYRAGINIAFGFASLVEWIRSHLPMYPNLFVPHVVEGANYVSQEFSVLGVIPWFDAGIFELHFGRPNWLELIEKELGIPPQHKSKFRSSLKKLRDCLLETNEWKGFAAMSKALNPPENDQMKLSCEKYKAAISEQALSREAGLSPYRRARYKSVILQRIMSEVPSNISEYYNKFKDMDLLINAVSSMISSSVLADSIEVEGYTEAVQSPLRTSISERKMKIKYCLLPGFQLPRLNGILSIDDLVPSFSGTLLVTGLSIRQKGLVEVSGYLLKDTKRVFG